MILVQRKELHIIWNYWHLHFFMYVSLVFSGERAHIVKKAQAVTVLDPSNFAKIALDDSKDVLVEFYAPCEYDL